MADDRQAGAVARESGPVIEPDGSTDPILGAREVRAETEVPLSGCLVRIAWMLAGPAALAFGAALIASPRGESTLVGTALLLGAALALVGLRYFDLMHLGGLRASGQAAGPADFRRYAGGVALVTALLWGLATLWRA